jgi:hypothetical protein
MKLSPFFRFTLAGGALLVLQACGSSGYDFGAPNVGAIVEAAKPSGLGAATFSAALKPAQSPSILATCSELASGAAIGTDQGKFLDALNCFTFREYTGRSYYYYRYWVNQLDSAMAQTQARLSEAEGADSADKCFNKTPTPMTFDFDIGGAAASTVTMKFSCWENQTVPAEVSAEGGSQKMAIGKDENHFYLMYITKTAATPDETGESHIVVLAKATVDGNQADIWVIGKGFQSAGGANEIRGDAIRVLANKSTEEFTFNYATKSGASPSTVYLRSNGTVAYTSGQSSQGGYATVAGQCFSASDTSSDGGAACTSAGLNSVPTEFGLASVFTQDGLNAGFLSDVDSISSTDFGAAGVGTL